MSRVVVSIPPSAEPVTRAEAKSFLYDYSGETAQDNVLDMLIAAARQRVEALLRASLVTQTRTWTMSYREANPVGRILRIPFGPVQSITSLTTYDDDAAGTATVYSVNESDQLVDSDSAVIGELVGEDWLAPRNDAWEIARAHAAATLVYVAGYGSVASWQSPGLGTEMQAIKAAILTTVADTFNDRESVAAGMVLREIPHSARNRLAPYRRGLA